MTEQVIAYRHDDWRPGEAQIDPDAPSVAEVAETMKAARDYILYVNRDHGNDETQRLDTLIARLGG